MSNAVVVSIVAERVAAIRSRIAESCARVGRRADSVTLVAVTKRFSADVVRDVVIAGVCDLGENYVQEAQQKAIELVGADKTVRWHMIGHLQRNKAKSAVGLFSLVQSVDSVHLARELDKEAARQNRTQPILVEVNLSRNTDRAGVLPEDCLAMVEAIRQQCANLQMQGLMGIPPQDAIDEAVRPYFRELHTLFDALPEAEMRQTLSMGMSGDFETAIEEGATMIRIGAAIFGQRPVAT